MRCDVMAFSAFLGLVANSEVASASEQAYKNCMSANYGAEFCAKTYLHSSPLPPKRESGQASAKRSDAYENCMASSYGAEFCARTYLYSSPLPPEESAKPPVERRDRFCELALLTGDAALIAAGCSGRSLPVGPDPRTRFQSGSNSGEGQVGNVCNCKGYAVPEVLAIRALEGRPTTVLEVLPIEVQVEPAIRDLGGQCMTVREARLIAVQAAPHTVDLAARLTMDRVGLRTTGRADRVMRVPVGRAIPPGGTGRNCPSVCR
jgi:hypothetical protein